MKKNEIISRSIQLLRFPLIVAVVFIHSIVISDNFHVLGIIKNVLSNTICHVAVPMFFLISGYLFFRNVSCFRFSIYARKLRSRFKTLVLPYIFWNFIVISFFAIGQMLFPSLFSGAFKSVKYFSFMDWLSIFWNSLGSGEPISFQLWFLRDLIVMVALTPLFYVVGRYGKWMWIIALVLLRLSGFDLNVPGFSSVAISFFGIGATFGIIKWDDFELPKWMVMTLAVIYVTVVIVEQFYFDAPWREFVHRAEVLLGCIVLAQVVFLLVKNGAKSNSLLTKYSFFIYCYHVVFLMVFSRLIKNLGVFHSEFAAITIYFFTPIIVVIIGICFYKFLELCLPRFLSVISGGR